MAPSVGEMQRALLGFVPLIVGTWMLPRLMVSRGSKHFSSRASLGFATEPGFEAVLGVLMLAEDEHRIEGRGEG